ncbi:hypothetical protein COCC4DRAFT_59059 [Bipolaris maydis ATCC 48331]|uniref:Uncharacterized protein n=2 Tax=Cochliobolus heterostrophus TaxID=5016 RepID=M2UI28_COCH5|nr:uncharacterized protein COCC4DRAFT_59059 [Bipolaris maydis ATCC 48331]EMD93316.1 hypothetical protein COCHEDRAFT_1028515 [Bipolaris maydis C5]ENI07235.1 hypothetical protein COCC4DRAFT_59059 [Bipolaris maydis ATCC 48331]
MADCTQAMKQHPASSAGQAASRSKGSGGQMDPGMIVLGLPAIRDSLPLLDSSRDTPRAAWRPLVAVLASRVSYSNSTSRPAPGGEFFPSISLATAAQLARWRQGAHEAEEVCTSEPMAPQEAKHECTRCGQEDSWGWLVQGAMCRLDKQCNQRRGGAGLVHGANTTYASTYREVMRHQIDMAGSQD